MFPHLMHPTGFRLGNKSPSRRRFLSRQAPNASGFGANTFLQEQFPTAPVARSSSKGGPIMAMEARETGSLIGSDKVEGTAVYGADNTKIGSIERVMIDKKSGRVSYAVLSFGGILGIGDDHYPLPWQSLKYDTNLGGYLTGITETQLKGAPKYGNDNAWNWNDPERARTVNDYYGVAIS
jgi:sporulation protein YlmC with PRC-barrel domain